MICSRCGALLVEDRLMDWATRWRCLKCGQVHDATSVQTHVVNERNRLHVLSAMPHRTDKHSSDFHKTISRIIFIIGH